MFTLSQVINEEMNCAVYEPICLQVTFFPHNYFTCSFPRGSEKKNLIKYDKHHVSFWQGQERSKNVLGLPRESKAAENIHSTLTIFEGLH